MNDELLKKSQTSIQGSITRVAKKTFKEDAAAAEKFVNESLGRLKYSPDVNESVKSTDLVVEAIVENMEVKHKLFSNLDKACQD